MTEVAERFIRYIKFNTQSNDLSETYPSTDSQLEFGHFLCEECKKIGLTDILMDKHGYVTATLSSNTEYNAPVIGFIAHMDTSPDASGQNITPLMIENYNAKEIKRDKNTLSPDEFTELLQYKSDTIITSDGSTLLGADDKAGIAEILTAMDYIKHNEIKHGKIRIAFTPDEEIGRGVDYFDCTAFGADFAYTIDGGRLGELEYENFNAARAIITIQGKSVHPGTAKGIMKNAALMAVELAQEFPKNETPSHTENYEGFFHLCRLQAEVETATLNYIIRDFEKENFEKRKQFVWHIVEKYNKKYGNCISVKIYDEYYNMASKIKNKFEIVELAEKSIKQCGITPIIKPIRGGTDGARLSYMGLPCPNIFTGGHNFHGPYEFIPVSSMEKAVNVIVKIAQMAVNKTNDKNFH